MENVLKEQTFVINADANSHVKFTNYENLITLRFGDNSGLTWEGNIINVNGSTVYYLHAIFPKDVQFIKDILNKHNVGHAVQLEAQRFILALRRVGLINND